MGKFNCMVSMYAKPQSRETKGLTSRNNLFARESVDSLDFPPPITYINVWFGYERW